MIDRIVKIKKLGHYATAVIPHHRGGKQLVFGTSRNAHAMRFTEREARSVLDQMRSRDIRSTDDVALIPTSR